jgi:hypothetical protein
MNRRSRSPTRRTTPDAPRKQQIPRRVLRSRSPPINRATPGAPVKRRSPPRIAPHRSRQDHRNPLNRRSPRRDHSPRRRVRNWRPRYGWRSPYAVDRSWSVLNPFFVPYATIPYAMVSLYPQVARWRLPHEYGHVNVDAVDLTVELVESNVTDDILLEGVQFGFANDPYLDAETKREIINYLVLNGRAYVADALV